ncbi:hypothetical protein BCR43DRAFT_481532 [Syncephalastrum racemosum]|uniref:ER membrane protein complex subunit 4 n=1 Tax=Syncephalastrum racemosum TaxID=13706 RepID=A0A1X2HS73_SYNRA|nr:hypothetical protein BCR43DRAFT_481532 [Syncephalastrum racemosum]
MASKWAVDFASIPKSKTTLANPIGFESGVLQNAKANAKASRSTSAQDERNDAAIKIKRAWDVAYSPAKSIPMNAIMIYMSGNGVQIFSVMITGMLFFQPIKAIMSLNQTFSRFETKDSTELLMPKFVFLFLQLVVMMLGVYKVNAMGLLPTTTSDWLAFLEPKKVLEYAAV